MKKIAIGIVICIAVGFYFHHLRKAAQQRALDKIENSATALPLGTYEKWSRAVNTGLVRYLRFSGELVFVTDPDIGTTNTYSIGIARPSCDPWGPDIMLSFEEGNAVDLITLAGRMNDDKDLHFEEIAPGVGPLSPAAEKLMADLCFELGETLDRATTRN